MKTITILIFIVFTIILKSQDYEPSQFRANYKGNDTLIDVTKMPEFQTRDKFVGGLHWGSTKLYVKNNSMTNIHCYSRVDSNIFSSANLPDSCNLTNNVYGIAETATFQFIKAKLNLFC